MEKDYTDRTIFKLKNGEHLLEGKFPKKPHLFLMLKNKWGIEEKIAFEYCSQDEKTKYYKQVSDFENIMIPTI